MSPRWTRLLAWLVIVTLALALAVLGARVTDVSAQEPVATAAAAPDGSLTPEGTPTPAGTPTPTFTPTITPSPTPTLTGLQARLLLAQTYLAGQDYDSAADLFAEIAGEDRGNVEAVTGLKAALDGKAAQMATMIAPLPTAEPFVAPTVPAPTVAQVTGSRLLDFASVVLAALAALVLLYLLATFIRWALAALRELWYLRVLPALQRPAVRPGLRLGTFSGAVGEAGGDAASVVPLVIAGKLSEWNQLVQRVQIPVELHTGPDLGAMGWIKVLWQWLIPQARGYEITGALVEGAGDVHRLAVQRSELGTHRIDRSATFEHAGEAGEAYRIMAAEAAIHDTSPLAQPQRLTGHAATSWPSTHVSHFETGGDDRLRGHDGGARGYRLVTPSTSHDPQVRMLVGANAPAVGAFPAGGLLAGAGQGGGECDGHVLLADAIGPTQQIGVRDIASGYLSLEERHRPFVPNYIPHSVHPSPSRILRYVTTAPHASKTFAHPSPSGLE